jgi:hypothetical protein
MAAKAWWEYLLDALASALTGKQLESAGTTPAEAAAGVTGMTTLGSGYFVAADRAERIHRLHQAQLAAVYDRDLQPTPDGRTFCNIASERIAAAMGYIFPPGLLANDMIAHIAASWPEDTLDRAHQHALKGGLAFVTLLDHPHGHLCSIAPQPGEYSSTWVAVVPLVANVGRTNGIMRVSGAFTAAERPRLRCFLLPLGDA